MIIAIITSILVFLLMGAAAWFLLLKKKFKPVEIPASSVINKTYNVEAEARVSFLTFGAIPNSSPSDGAVNDSYEAIQTALDSGFSLDNPAGCFYVSKPLVIKNPIEIKNVGGNYFYYNWSHQKFDWPKNQFGNRQTVIYTDKNIDLLTIQSPNVKIFGGLFDTSQAEWHAKAAIRYDLSYPIWGTKLEGIAVMGNHKTLSEVGNGTIGVHFDLENASEPQEADMIMGWLHAGRISGEMGSVSVGVLKSKNENWKASVNSINFDVNMVDYKQAFNLPGMTECYITGVLQECDNLKEEEREKFKHAVEAGYNGTEIDVIVFDLKDEPNDKTGLYRRQRSIKVLGKGAMLGPKSLNNLSRGRVTNSHFLRNDDLFKNLIPDWQTD